MIKCHLSSEAAHHRSVFRPTLAARGCRLRLPRARREREKCRLLLPSLLTWLDSVTRRPALLWRPSPSCLRLPLLLLLLVVMVRLRLRARGSVRGHPVVVQVQSQSIGMVLRCASSLISHPLCHQLSIRCRRSNRRRKRNANPQLLLSRRRRNLRAVSLILQSTPKWED